MLLIILFLAFFTFSSGNKSEKREFAIDYDSNTFVLNGEPFTYASGEMHYFRVPKAYWRDRLNKIRFSGLNTVSTYIEWSLHEPSSNNFVFEGEADIAEFIKIAQQEDLFVIVRPGPYICAEREFGGYPSWLLTANPKMRLRTSDPSHTFFIARWFKHLMGQLQPLFYNNGGPIIMVQIENEYGSYPVNDPNYTLWLRDLYRSYVGNAAVLFTTDGPGRNFVTRGKIPGVLTTIDFGPTTTDMDSMYRPMRKVQPKGPRVNSEFYVGWLSYWGEPFSKTGIEPIIATLGQFLQNNISFNLYMFHGGTNFGFTAGSGSSKHFQADLTSYDYDAPITEAGDLTDKYFAIKDAIKEIYPQGGSGGAKKSSDKGNYGTVQLSPVETLLKSPVGSAPVMSEFPITFEELGQRYGFVAYSATVPYAGNDPSVLQVNVRDRAIVLIDEEEVSVLQYTYINETPLPSTLKAGQKLTLLIENLGRRNYQLLSDCTKGLISNATIDGALVKNWEVVGYPLNPEDIKKIENLFEENKNKVIEVVEEEEKKSETESESDDEEEEENVNEPEKSTENVIGAEEPSENVGEEQSESVTSIDEMVEEEEVPEVVSIKSGQKFTKYESEYKVGSPTFYLGTFQIPERTKPLDTFLDMSQWGKGVVFINNFNLGRYWHIGPQLTLYVPGCYLKEYPENNTIVLLELHYTHPDKTVTFVTEPILDFVQDAENNENNQDNISVTNLYRR